MQSTKLKLLISLALNVSLIYRLLGFGRRTSLLNSPQLSTDYFLPPAPNRSFVTLAQWEEEENNRPTVSLGRRETTVQSLPLFRSSKSTAQSWQANETCNSNNTSDISSTISSSPPPFDCTPSGKRWPHPILVDPCSSLLQHNITSILFLGDSYIRQLYTALLLVVSRDYTRGALGFPFPPRCEGPGQFEEKRCRQHLALRYGACRGRLQLSCAGSGRSARLTPQRLRQHDRIVWGVGAHFPEYQRGGKAKEGQRGRNNATAYREIFFRPVCRDLPQEVVREKVYFVNNHVRLRAVANASYLDPEEQLAALWRYHDEIPGVLQEVCGVEKIISVWDATYSLAMEHLEDAQQMTYDGVHWGREINLLKAHELLWRLDQEGGEH